MKMFYSILLEHQLVEAHSQIHESKAETLINTFVLFGHKKTYLNRAILIIAFFQQ